MSAIKTLCRAALTCSALAAGAAVMAQEPGTSSDGTPTLYTQCTMNPGLCDDPGEASAPPKGSVFGDAERDARLNEALNDTFACVFGFGPCVNRTYPDDRN